MKSSRIRKAAYVTLPPSALAQFNITTRCGGASHIQADIQAATSFTREAVHCSYVIPRLWSLIISFLSKGTSSKFSGSGSELLPSARQRSYHVLEITTARSTHWRILDFISLALTRMASASLRSSLLPSSISSSFFRSAQAMPLRSMSEASTSSSSSVHGIRFCGSLICDAAIRLCFAKVLAYLCKRAGGRGPSSGSATGIGGGMAEPGFLRCFFSGLVRAEVAAGVLRGLELLRLVVYTSERTLGGRAARSYVRRR